MELLLTVVALSIAWLVLRELAAAIFDAIHRRRAAEDRIRLAGPDDQDLDLAAALRPGPLPSYSEERDELEARRCR